MLCSNSSTPARRGVILLVVLAILTLIALVGITFVLYSDSISAAARTESESASLSVPDMDPYQCFALFLGQLIYDAPDDGPSSPNGVLSALRGHSLARNMYGWRTAAGLIGNTTAFNGLGRLHFNYLSSVDAAATPINGLDEWQLINYTWFHTLDDVATGNLIRDPEFFGIRNGALHKWGGGLNPPYTYPDLNSLFLGVIRPSDGAVIARSYHRDYTGFGPFWVKSGAQLIKNPNWTTPSVRTKPLQAGLKYMVLRPRPADNPDPVTGNPGDPRGFPFPEDVGGDVKNIITSPGYIDPSTGKQANNDSFWIDIGAPVLTSPDGRKYKMLVAPFICSLDGKVDVNAVGNIRVQPSISGLAYGHGSNMGFGPWEINPFSSATGATQVLNGQNTVSNKYTYQNLFTGMPSGPAIQGKYGPAVAPNTIGLPYWHSNTAVPGRPPHYYSQIDFDGCSGYQGASNPGTVTGPLSAPSTTALFPSFPLGYENGSLTAGSTTYTERTDHPLLFDVFSPSVVSSSQYNRRFSPTHLERLLRFGDTGYWSLPSDLERLTVENFNNYDQTQYPSNAGWDGTSQGSGSAQRRWLVTTNSADRIAPGLTPYIFNPTLAGSVYGYAGGTTDYSQAPSGGPLAYADPTQQPRVYGVAPTAAPATGEFFTDYRATGVFDWAGKTGDFNVPPPGYQWPTGAQLQTALSRINLNRVLTPYPLYDSKLGFSPSWTNPQSGNTFNQMTGSASALYSQYQEATADRQRFADEIYRRLLLVTGVPPAAAPSTPTDAELAPRRWLAQLAVNVVDYIDEDDIMTPFCFYNNQDDPKGKVVVGATYTPPANPGGWPAPPATDLPKYWVVGTELPKVVLNEVSLQCENAVVGSVAPAAPYHIAAWVELLNAVTQQTVPRQAPGQPQDGYPVPLLGGDGVTAPYQIVIAGALYNAPTTPTAPAATLPAGIGLQGNPLGTYNYLKAMTAPTDFQSVASTYQGTAAYGSQPKATITTQGSNPPTNNVAATLSSPYIDVNPTAPAKNTPYFIVAPNLAAGGATAWNYADFLQQTAATTVPTSATVAGGTPFIKTTNMMYKLTTGFTLGSTGDPKNDERGTGLTVLLRRLANPHLPYQPTPGTGDWNPYVTVDYMTQVPILGNFTNNASLKGNPLASRGKLEPFAGASEIQTGNPAASPVRFEASASMTQEQSPNDAALSWSHTFGQANVGTQGNLSAYDWLVHLDRQVVSPAELFHVSGYPPFQQLRRFVDVNPGNGAKTYCGQMAPWFDPNETLPTAGSNRLYRLFEFLDAGNRGAGVVPNGRVAGKINLNDIWDERTFVALCDPNASNHINSYALVHAIYGNMMNSASTGRTPSGAPGLPRDFDSAAFTAAGFSLPSGFPTATDRPFLGFATGLTSAPGAAGYQFPNSRGIDDTIFRSYTSGVNVTRLFENSADYGSTTTPTGGLNYPAAHPYLAYQLLMKMANNVTTRSNVFAVWATAGFFEVTNANSVPVTLGAEIGKSEGRNIRHRAFAIVDRSNLAAFQTTSTAAITVTTPDANGGQGYSRVSLNTVMPISGTDSRTGLSWSLQAGMMVVFEPGTDNEDDVNIYADSSGTNLVGEFHQAHASGVPVIVRGNPGPWLHYDPRQDTGVVLHWNIIN
jgi:hypothetical protein